MRHCHEQVKFALAKPLVRPELAADLEAVDEGRGVVRQVKVGRGVPVVALLPAGPELAACGARAVVVERVGDRDPERRRVVRADDVRANVPTRAAFSKK